MLKQQVNLYQPVFRKQQVQFSAASVMGVVLLMLVVLSGITSYSWWQKSELQSAQTRMAEMVAGLEIQVGELSQSIATPAINKMLEAELNALQENRRDGFKLLSALRTQSGGSKEGFSAFFEGLARHVHGGVWLTSVQISGGGQNLVLNGKTEEPAMVPQLLQRLRAERVFDGQTFQVMALKQQELDSGALLFALQTSVDDKPGAADGQ